MPIGSSKIGVLGAGLVPGGTETFNAPGTFSIPPGVKKVSITGKGGTGNPGVAGNPGNPGNPANGGGGGGGAETNFIAPGIGPQVSPGYPGGIGFKPGLAPLLDNFWFQSKNCPGGWYKNACQRNNLAMPYAQGARRQCALSSPVRPATNSSSGLNGCSGSGGNAGAAGCGGTAGNAGQTSSGLTKCFLGGQGGNAPPGGAAGNGGTGGQGGGGGTTSAPGSAGNGAGAGGASLSGVNAVGNIPPNPNNVAVIQHSMGGGGAGIVNNGQNGLPAFRANAPANTNQVSRFVAMGGTDPLISTPKPSRAANEVQPTNYNTPGTGEAFNELGSGGGGGGGCGFGRSAFMTCKVDTPETIYNNPGVIPTVRRLISCFNPACLRPSLFRAGAGGGSAGFICTPPNCASPSFTIGGSGGGGGRGNAGNAGGNSPTVSGQVATPATFNCVTVTPGCTAPITVGTPGGQIVISWNPQ
jgi:hypothetical protein